MVEISGRILSTTEYEIFDFGSFLEVLDSGFWRCRGLRCNFLEISYKWVCNKLDKRPRWPNSGEKRLVRFYGPKNRKQAILTVSLGVSLRILAL